MASKEPKMSKKGTGGKGKNVTFTPHKLEIIGRNRIPLCLVMWPPYRSIHKTLHVRTQANVGRLHLKCDGTNAENRFRLSAKWTSQRGHQFS